MSIIMPDGSRHQPRKEKKVPSALELDFLLLVRKHFPLMGLGKKGLKGERDLQFKIPKALPDFQGLLMQFMRSPGSIFSIAYAPEINSDIDISDLGKEEAEDIREQMKLILRLGERLNIYDVVDQLPTECPNCGGDDVELTFQPSRSPASQRHRLICLDCGAIAGTPAGTKE